MLDVPRRQGQRPPHPWESEWTEERVDLLKKLWAEGKSQAEIAGALGLNSRGAVAGKIQRLGLSHCGGPKDVTRYRRSRRSTKQRVVLAAEIKPAPGEGRFALTSLDKNMCHFPYGEGPFLFCGERTPDGASYCAAHHAIAYRSESTSA